jgi:hypothetical protein
MLHTQEHCRFLIFAEGDMFNNQRRALDAASQKNNEPRCDKLTRICHIGVRSDFTVHSYKFKTLRQLRIISFHKLTHRKNHTQRNTGEKQTGSAHRNKREREARNWY